MVEKMDVSGYTAMLGLVAEMVLDESIRKRKEKMLYQGIDEALANGDEDAFITLTHELKQLLSQ